MKGTGEEVSSHKHNPVENQQVSRPHQRDIPVPCNYSHPLPSRTKHPFERATSAPHLASSSLEQSTNNNPLFNLAVPSSARSCMSVRARQSSRKVFCLPGGRLSLPEHSLTSPFVPLFRCWRTTNEKNKTIWTPARLSIFQERNLWAVFVCTTHIVVVIAIERANDGTFQLVPSWFIDDPPLMNRTWINESLMVFCSINEWEMNYHAVDSRYHTFFV